MDGLSVQELIAMSYVTSPLSRCFQPDRANSITSQCRRDPPCPLSCPCGHPPFVGGQGVSYLSPRRNLSISSYHRPPTRPTGGATRPETELAKSRSSEKWSRRSSMSNSGTGTREPIFFSRSHYLSKGAMMHLITEFIGVVFGCQNFPDPG